ncbi:MAG: hypothetical protein WA695_01205 [Candidatus Dormiibacterota bacterium]
MPAPRRNPTPPGLPSTEEVVAERRVRVAETEFYLRQVELACIRSGCDPAYCRVRDSLQDSLRSERAELARLRSYPLVDKRQAAAA